MKTALSVKLSINQVPYSLKRTASGMLIKKEAEDNQTYTIEEGVCSCPAYENNGHCKHLNSVLEIFNAFGKALHGDHPFGQGA